MENKSRLENTETYHVHLSVELCIVNYDFFNKSMYRIVVLAVGQYLVELFFFAFDKCFHFWSFFKCQVAWYLNILIHIFKHFTGFTNIIRLLYKNRIANACWIPLSLFVLPTGQSVGFLRISCIFNLTCLCQLYLLLWLCNLITYYIIWQNMRLKRKDRFGLFQCKQTCVLWLDSIKNS